MVWIAILLLVIGFAAIIRGLRLTENRKDQLAYGFPMGDGPVGCLVGFVGGLLFAGLLRILPLWMVRMLWFLIGIGFVVLGIMTLRAIH